jgi:CheY-like chemotaxis protein
MKCAGRLSRRGRCGDSSVQESVSSERLVRTVHLSDDQITAVLDRLDSEDSGHAPDRRHQRYVYRIKALVVHMQQPGSSMTVPYGVPTRNISEGGIAFLHGGFVHVGTRCLVRLISTYGTWDDVWGAVVRSAYVTGSIHEVAVQFDRRIDPSAYCVAAVRSRVLLAEDDEATARLVMFHLQQLNAESDHAENGRVAVDKAMANVYDVILLDMDMPVMDGFEAVKELRTRGYTGTVVAATALTQPGDEQRCLEAGCDKYVTKPYTRDDLGCLLRSLRQEPLISAFYNDPGMVDMITAYVKALPTKVRALEDGLVRADLKRLETVTRTLKAEGAGYGFEVITEAAAKIESALINGATVDDIRKEVAALMKLCNQARASSSL